MPRPWMPLYIADYRADTAHLGALEHGIYLLLIMHYWQTGSLPDDDRQLARIACCSSTEWKRSKPVIEKFFEPGWKHGRIDEELAKAKEISCKRRGAALEMHSNRRANASAHAEQKQTQPQSPSQSHPQKKEDSTGVKVKSWTPPKHGAISTRSGRVYIQAGSDEWEAYARDYRDVHGCEPTPNQHGGKWFKTLGEAAE